MTSPSIKLIALLLLVVQGVVSMAAGRVLCISAHACVGHQHAAPMAGGHGDTHGCECSSREADEAGQDFVGLLGESIRAASRCDCHVHVPIPDDDRLPSRVRSEVPERSVVPTPLAWPHAERDVRVHLVSFGVRFKSPDFAASDQVQSLKAARLLI